jgi:hypothetical protein
MIVRAVDRMFVRRTIELEGSKLPAGWSALYNVRAARAEVIRSPSQLISMTLNKVLPLFLLSFIVVACSDSSGSRTPSLTGSWGGTLEGATVNFVATETSNSISGNGFISSGELSIAITLTGTHAHPNVSLTIQSSGFEDMSFTGSFVSDDQIAGRVNGSGFVNTTLSINRTQ